MIALAFSAAFSGGGWAWADVRPAADDTDAVDVSIRPVAVQPEVSRMLAQLSFVPGNDLAIGGLLVAPLTLEVNSAGGAEVSFAADRAMQDVELVFPLEGDRWLYPFDEHAATITLRMLDAQSLSPVATAAAVHPGQHEWRVASTVQQEAPPFTTTVELAFSRGIATIAFVGLELLLIAGLPIAAAAAIAATLRSGKPLEFSMVGWVTALLVIVPAVRASMPGVPGLGALVDYVVFFPALLLLVACLLVTATLWIRQNSSREEQS